MRRALLAIGFGLLCMLASAAECATVECWPDPAVGTACRCTQGATPPSCVDFGSCLQECPGS